MPRFHFNVYDGKSSPDMRGTELPDYAAARVAAIRFAGEVLKDEADRLVHHEDWRVEMTDDTGLILFWVALAMVTPAAIPNGIRGCGDV